MGYITETVAEAVTETAEFIIFSYLNKTYLKLTVAARPEHSLGMN